MIETFDPAPVTSPSVGRSYRFLCATVKRLGVIGLYIDSDLREKTGTQCGSSVAGVVRNLIQKFGR